MVLHTVTKRVQHTVLEIGHGYYQNLRETIDPFPVRQEAVP